MYDRFFFVPQNFLRKMGCLDDDDDDECRQARWRERRVLFFIVFSISLDCAGFNWNCAKRLTAELVDAEN
jgi:hypothetical protein